MTSSLFQVARFFISGCLSAVGNLGTLYLLHDLAGMWYIASSVFGFLAGFVISFTLQKFWTFRDARTDVLGRQLLIYLTLVIINLGFNTLFVYVFVEYAGLRPLFAQALSALIIAVEGYFAYKLLVFRPQRATEPAGDA